jgi:hypothetical protein
VSDSPNDLQALLSIVQSQQATIERLLKLVEERESTVPPPPPPDETEKKQEQRPIDWFKLSGRERMEVWEELAAFVADIVRRYNLHLVITPCWWQHSDAVEEFTALWQIRQASFAEDASLNAAMSWQDNIAKCRERLGGLLGSCRDGHVDMTARTAWMSESVWADFRRAIRVDSFGTGSEEPED